MVTPAIVARSITTPRTSAVAPRATTPSRAHDQAFTRARQMHVANGDVSLRCGDDTVARQARREPDDLCLARARAPERDARRDDDRLLVGARCDGDDRSIARTFDRFLDRAE